MFDNIAHSYDKLNHRLSWNIDKLWRNKALKRLKPYSPQRMLDIATGTGDFAIQATKTLNPKELVGVDISEGMMEVGRKKIAQLGMDAESAQDRWTSVYCGTDHPRKIPNATVV